MRERLAWAAAIFASILVLAAIAILWRWEGTAVGISVGLPVGATLLTPLVSWVVTVWRQAGPSTLEHLTLARQALSSRGLGECGRVLPPPGPRRGAGSAVLRVPWMESAPATADGGAGATVSDVAGLAARMSAGRRCHLVLLGEARCGKTTLARLLMQELLQHAQPGDPVPVFPPVATWDPDRERLREWMVRRIRAEMPELRDESSFGPAAVEGLVIHRMLLPVLDGCDDLPEAARHSVLSGDDLQRCDRLILTCRQQEFLAAAGGSLPPDTVVLTPGHVALADAADFLRRTTGRPERWDAVFGHARRAEGPLSGALSRPRTLLLTRDVYRDSASDPGELMPDPPFASAAAIEDHLLRRLFPALLPRDGLWSERFPWYGDRAMEWLRFIARTVRDDATGGISWWNVYRSVRFLRAGQAVIRAVLMGGATFAVVALMMNGRYGRLTGLAYGLAAGAACLFLAPGAGRRPDPPFTRPAPWWWLRRALRRSWRAAGAGLTVTVAFGAPIGYRTALVEGWQRGLSTGLVDGLVAGMVVMLGAVIAGIPAPPRTVQAAHPDTARPRTVSITLALAPGVPFGLLTGLLSIVKHQHVHGPTPGQGVAYGLVMGLDFVVGAWLVRWIQGRLVPADAPDPRSAFRADRALAVLVPLILGLVFASAFGLNSGLHWDRVSGIANGLVGVVVGSLSSEWPLYLLSIAYLAAKGRVPLRFMTFLKCCQGQGVLREAGQSYRFSEDPGQALPLACQTDRGTTTQTPHGEPAAA